MLMRSLAAASPQHCRPPLSTMFLLGGRCLPCPPPAGCDGAPLIILGPVLGETRPAPPPSPPPKTGGLDACCLRCGGGKAELLNARSGSTTPFSSVSSPRIPVEAGRAVNLSTTFLMRGTLDRSSMAATPRPMQSSCRDHQGAGRQLKLLTEFLR